MAKNITRSDLAKQDFLVLKQSRDGTITQVLAPNGLQIGLSDPGFQSTFTTKGPLVAEQGLTGSLTHLTDGTPYLLSGGGIQIATGSSGQITLTATAAVTRSKVSGFATQDFAALDPITLNSSANLNTIGVNDTDSFIDIYHNQKLMMSGTVAEVTAGDRDYYVDHSNNIVKFSFAVNTGDSITSLVISSGSQSVPSAGNGLIITNNVYDINLATNSGLQISSDELQLDLKSAGGLTLTSNELLVDPTNLAVLASGVDATNDKLMIYDANAATLKAVAPSLIAAAYASLDIASVSNSLTESTLASGDLLGVADINDSNEVKKITVEDFGQYLAAGTNAGIGESSGKLTIDLNNLSAAAVDVSADSIAIVDATDNSSKKESIADLITGIAGTVTATGLAASSGVLSVDISNQTDISTAVATGDFLLLYDTSASALKKVSVNNLQAGSAAPPAAQYVVLSTDGTLSHERVLTAGDGLDLADGGAGSTVTLAVDVTDFIDASYGLTEDSNNIRVDLKSSGGLAFNSGEIEVDYGTASGQAAEGSNTVTITAGDGLKSGGTVTIGSSASSVQLDVDVSDFAGTGLTASGDNLHVQIGGGNNLKVITGSSGEVILTGSSYFAGAGLDLSGYTFLLDLKSSGGLKIDSTELAIDDSVVATLSGSTFTGPVSFRGNVSEFTATGSVKFNSGLSGSLTTLTDGTPYLLAGFECYFGDWFKWRCNYCCYCC